jgi:hypothetical protein
VIGDPSMLAHSLNRMANWYANAKLHFSSRAQIAAWAVEKALLPPSQDS